jgi:site-specific recombinase XerD
VSYVHDLADILADVTNSFQVEVNTIRDGIHAYMIDYVRRGCSMKTIFNAYVDLTRFAADVECVDNGGQPMPLEKVTRNVIEAHLARLSLVREIKCTKKPSPSTVERRRRVVKAFLRWLFSEEYILHNPTKKIA